MPNNFLVLDKDGQKARIRFTGSSADNVAIVDTYMPDSNGVMHKVKCIHIPIYNEELQCDQIWSRTIFSYNQLRKIYEQYDNVPSYIFEIIRHGNKFDLHTYYTCIAVGKIPKD